MFKLTYLLSVENEGDGCFLKELMKAKGFITCACQQCVHKFKETMSSQHHEVEATALGKCFCCGDRVDTQPWPQFLKSIPGAFSTSYLTSPARLSPPMPTGRPCLTSSWQKCCCKYTFHDSINAVHICNCTVIYEVDTVTVSIPQYCAS